MSDREILQTLKDASKHEAVIALLVSAGLLPEALAMPGDTLQESFCPLVPSVLESFPIP